MTKFVVATTLAAFVMDNPDTYAAWLYNSHEMREIAEDWGDEVQFFAALELDGRGIEPFEPLLEELTATHVRGVTWTYTLDDGRTDVTTNNRLRHIVVGQNLANDYAKSVGADYLLFMAADCAPPADALWTLKECADDFDARVVGGHVSTYCLTGPEVAPNPTLRPGMMTYWTEAPNYYPVQEHMPTAAFVLLDRVAFRTLGWRWDLEDGSDDPCLYKDAQDRGYRVVVRHDVIGQHYPECISSIETRYPGRDMSVKRG